MISPGITVADVEPDGFGLLCALAGQRVYRRPVELQVLHDHGRVLRAVHTVDGVTHAFDGEFTDAGDFARQLRSMTGVDRAVVIDRDGLLALAPALAAAGDPHVDQMTMIERSNDIFWSSPAVVADPPVERDASAARAAAVRTHLFALGDDWWALLAAYRGDECVMTVAGRFRSGLLVHLTSLTPVLGEARPPRSRATELVTAAERLGPVKVALIADVDDLAAVAGGEGDDVMAMLAAMPAIVSFGWPQ